MSHSEFVARVLLAINTVITIYYSVLLTYFLYRLAILKLNGITNALTVFFLGRLFYCLVNQRGLVMLYFELSEYSANYVPFSELVLQLIGASGEFLAMSLMIVYLYQDATYPRKRKVSKIIRDATAAMESITKPTKPRVNTDIYKITVEELKEDGGAQTNKVD